jgi:hypothetical protein
MGGSSLSSQTMMGAPKSPNEQWIEPPAVELGMSNRSVIYVEAKGALAESFNGSIHFQFAERSKINKSDGARAVRCYLFFGEPAIDRTPIIQGHIVHAVGYYRATINYVIALGAVNDKDPTGDYGGSARRDLAVNVNAVGLKMLDENSPARLSRATPKDAAA